MLTVSGMTIRGDLIAHEDLTFDGTFEGSIELPGHHFVAGKNARVNAAITARAVTVDGRVEGHITADVLDLGPTARVHASVLAPRLAVEEGAEFNGPVNTERARAAGTILRRKPKPA